MARSRGHAANLTQADVFEAALEVADAHGVAGVSLRAVARRLGVTPMALYHHVEDKQTLLQGLLGYTLRKYVPAGHETPGHRAWVMETFRRIRTALHDHPSLASLVSAWTTVGPDEASMQWMLHVLQRLEHAGLSPGEAVGGFYDLLGYTLGYVQLELATSAHRVGDGGTGASYATLLRRASPAQKPAQTDALAHGWTDARFERGLERWLAVAGVA